jgi:hypothetical protein
MENYHKIQEDKSEYLRNIFTTSKNIENFNLKINQVRNDDEYQKNKQIVTKNIEIFFNIYDKNKTYCSILDSQISTNLKKYHMDVIGLKEIFERKDKLEEKVRKLKNIQINGKR